MIKYFDIHSHLDFPDYGPDFNNVIENMNQAEIGTITIGTNLESAKKAVALAEKYENIWACIGIHPADGDAEVWNETEFEKLINHPKVVAVGECGLDYFRLPENVATEKDRQKILFEKQIQFAIKHDKTLMIHCRDIKDSYQAYTDIYEILKKAKMENLNLRIHLHFFAGDLDIAKKFLELDATFSFTGVITFATQYDEVIKFLPLEKIMSETDAPFVAPVPYRGKRNEPAYVVEVVKKLAELKNMSVDDLNKVLIDNTQRIFSIKITRIT